MFAVFLNQFLNVAIREIFLESLLQGRSHEAGFFFFGKDLIWQIFAEDMLEGSFNGWLGIQQSTVQIKDDDRFVTVDFIFLGSQ